MILGRDWMIWSRLKQGFKSLVEVELGFDWLIIKSDDEKLCYDWLIVKSGDVTLSYDWLIVESGDVTLSEYEASAAGLVKSIRERFQNDGQELDNIITDLIRKDQHLWSL